MGKKKRGVNCIHRDQVRDKFSGLYSRNRIIEKRAGRLYKEREVFRHKSSLFFRESAYNMVVRVKVERRLRIKKEQHDSM
jgi:hypothetical protein